MLEGWRDAVHGGRYAGVRYDCASASVANWIHRLAKKVWLTQPAFSVMVQTTAEEIATLARADAEREGRAADEPEAAAGAAPTPKEKIGSTPTDVRILGSILCLCREPMQSDRPRGRRRRRRPPNESGAIERSSGSPSQSAADGGDAE